MDLGGLVGIEDRDWPFPVWAASLLACPACKEPAGREDGILHCGKCGEVGRWENGIARFSVRTDDPSINWYAAKGGTQFMERTRVPFTMTSLDTPVYHSHLKELAPEDKGSLIVDVGAGDGRNTAPWLDWGYKRIIAVDPVASSLERFGAWAFDTYPDCAGRVLLVEGDARALPVASQVADVALAIESLYYLNEDYARGLGECTRIMSRRGRLMISERSWEGALLMKLLYGGVREVVRMRDNRYVLDGPAEQLVRSRTFTEEELLSIVRDTGLVVEDLKGLSVLSVVLGYLRGEGRISPNDEQYLPEVIALLKALGATGKALRTHIVVARKE